MKLIFILVGTLLINKIAYLRLRKPKRDLTEAKAPITNDCLVPITHISLKMKTIMVNGDTYRTMITDLFVSAIYGLKPPWSSRYVGLLDVKPAFVFQVKHQHENMKIFLRRFQQISGKNSVGLAIHVSN